MPTLAFRCICCIIQKEYFFGINSADEWQAGTAMLFWDVDTQTDFLLPGGHLYVPGSELIVPNLARLTNLACSIGVMLISSACAHLPGDPELKIYGQHCMAGTPGQQKVSETLLRNRRVIPNRPVELPNLHDFQQVIIEKQDFDVFTNPNTERVLQQFGSALHIVLYGVVTEICVASAALQLLHRGHRVELVHDATQAIDDGKASMFLQEFIEHGGEVTDTDKVLANYGLGDVNPHCDAAD
jgi:nicotinamidase/pyrazinamidase